jgi:hypothetical protein
MAVSGSMTFTLTDAGNGTLLKYEYAVGGYAPDGVDRLAEPVDRVQQGQLQRLQRYIETGNPAVAAPAAPDTVLITRVCVLQRGNCRIAPAWVPARPRSMRAARFYLDRPRRQLTVARGSAPNRFKLFPDHLAVDLVNSVFDSGMRPYVRIREWAWMEVLREAVHMNLSLVFTFKPQATIRTSFISHACVVIERLGGDIVFVELTCPEPVIESRIENADRQALHKLASVDEYRRQRDQGAFHSARCQRLRCASIPVSAARKRGNTYRHAPRCLTSPQIAQKKNPLSRASSDTVDHPWCAAVSYSGKFLFPGRIVSEPIRNRFGTLQRVPYTTIVLPLTETRP